MLTKRQANSIIRRIEKSRDAIAKERDKLEDLMEEIDNLKDTSNRAHEDLESAISALSEFT